MSSDIEKKLNSLFGSGEGEKLKNIAKSPELQKLRSQISEEEKSKIVEEFLKMDTETLRQKLKNADLSRLKGIDFNKFFKKWHKREALDNGWYDGYIEGFAWRWCWK